MKVSEFRKLIREEVRKVIKEASINDISDDIIKKPYKLSFYDQPYIVYNAFKYNLYDNKILKKLVVNNNKNIYSDKVIHHFPGGPGFYEHKIDSMTIFLNKLKNKYDIMNKIMIISLMIIILMIIILMIILFIFIYK